MNAKKFFTLVSLLTASILLAACTFGLQTPWGFIGISDTKQADATSAAAAPEANRVPTPVTYGSGNSSAADDNGDNGYAPAAGPTTGIPVTWSPLAKNTAAIVREIVWLSDGSSAEVWVYWTDGMPEDLLIGAAWDGQSGHVRDAWTSSDGQPWPSMAYEACKEASAVVAGGLGITNVTVHLADGQGGFTDVPADCSAYSAGN
ncbi:hypothetical protein A3B40_01960 [Candidatus Roizmanbacteria bacterium RIFCSPLOWO2_01_FULL_37_16]|uniref:von Hippel-Lindau disease tumour suppressor beta domain-containing protein n=1 Tax=Candidatus Roizmanbacteria bacterium RIFCSPLOWO2_01_FULL_37_16 TaxID=1802058 RepID=A0A1F7IJD1_9BACT|nr:MAG: hypothetical protein A2859_02765 [Candidatus Roizmanbacteria bacterium RIFCSPHIGHO2_01_FULL_37_16b]OGK43469.1 MAG: hypothetical protein A3B40_01960 [Candidatus Roizmanbacteria bacterium RIFCSPLOWO2_01_FULL_37_16]